MLWELQKGFLEAGVLEMNPEQKTVVGQAEGLRAVQTEGAVESEAGVSVIPQEHSRLFPLPGRGSWGTGQVSDRSLDLI